MRQRPNNELQMYLTNKIEHSQIEWQKIQRRLTTGTHGSLQVSNVSKRQNAQLKETVGKESRTESEASGHKKKWFEVKEFVE